MTRCSECDGTLVRFEVPESLAGHAPSETATICATCLDVTTGEATGADTTAATDKTTATDDTARAPAFDRIHERFPTAEGGVAFALLVGTLPSVTLRKEEALALREHAERHGVDTHLAFDRLIDASEAGALEPGFDLARRVRSFESLADGV